MPTEPVKPDQTVMTEWEKRQAGEPFDSAKLYQEMNDSSLDAIIQGAQEAKAPSSPSKAPPSKVPSSPGKSGPSQ